MKKFVVILLTVVLLSGGVFVFGGDDEGIASFESLNPGEIVSYIEESW
ncbi:hypothetical protein X928_07430 [Petrotoga miotherma DSM 10691]|jgi:hypothetical protein|uniref:Uncharacterized protein n=1 Tax=Petrotoga miotherma DSM 10691 TaxID=1434326 RepID=A0A2K1P993_9BACT|nr:MULTISPECIES: hypothetical protein [Petrotoga]PNR99375.1 hypothetical protein X928_07430 [Petrotoga miotherma DSM 10691]